jgi:hypothetical protein
MHSEVIIESVPPEELVVVIPHLIEQVERDREGEESLHGSKQFLEGIGDLQRHHKQRNCETKDGISKTFDAQYFLASPRETFFAADPSLR